MDDPFRGRLLIASWPEYFERFRLIWGMATSRAHQKLIDPRQELDVGVGWVTYLSRRLGTVPPLPAPVRVEPVEDRGTLVTLTPERFTASNPEHVALAHRVRELLERAGLLHPPPPDASR